MINLLEKAGDFTNKFLSNLHLKIEKDIYLKESLSRIENNISSQPILSKIYKNLQFSDFLIFNFTKEHFKTRKFQGISKEKDSCIDMAVDRIVKIPQYYGGVPNDSKIINSRLIDKLPALSFIWNKCIPMPIKTRLDSSYKEFQVMKRLENEIIPEIFKNLFLFKKCEFTSLESEETLKQLKNYILSQEDWKNKKIFLEDVRRVETKRIYVKNLKKTIKIDLELTVVLTGDSDESNAMATGNGLIVRKGYENNLRSHFCGSFDFVNENGKWIAFSFAYSPFN
jgi:hypothetical protein